MKNKSDVTPNKSKSGTLYKKIVDQAKTRFSMLDTDLKKYSLKQLEETLKVDEIHPIVLLPNMFANALLDKKKKIRKSLLVDLGLANIYGWVAYTIYDDFLDDEGEVKSLSVANVCLRELSQIYSNHPLYREVMNKIDSANAWEVSWCRMDPKSLFTKKVSPPDYGDFSRLADRSLGHSLGPVSILLEIGYSPASKEVKSLMSFFKHYLIARQLNDDMHDWEQDLRMGHINAVGSMLLKNYYKNYIGKKKNRTMEKMQEIFWQKEISSICDLSTSHVNLAKAQIDKLSSVFDPKLLMSMMVKIEAITKEVMEERERALKFINTFAS